MKKILFLFLLFYIFSCKGTDPSILNPNGGGNNTSDNSESSVAVNTSGNSVSSTTVNTVDSTSVNTIDNSGSSTTVNTSVSSVSTVSVNRGVIPGIYRGDLSLTLFRGVSRIEIPEPVSTYIVFNEDGSIVSEIFDRLKLNTFKKQKNGSYEYYAEYKNAYKGTDHKVEIKKVSDSTISVVIVSERVESGTKYIYAYSGELSR